MDAWNKRVTVIHVDVNNLIYGMVFWSIKSSLYAYNVISKNRFDTGDKDFIDEKSILELAYEDQNAHYAQSYNTSFQDVINLVRKKTHKVFGADTTDSLRYKYYFDCPSRLYQGHGVYSQYKANRRSSVIPAHQEFFNIRCSDLIKSICKERTDLIYKEDNCEADFLIAKNIIRINQATDLTSHVIVSNDSDFYQLQMIPFVVQYDLFNNKIIDCKEPSQEVLQKIVRGEASDNIPNILSDLRISGTRLSTKQYHQIIRDLDSYKSNYAKYYERNKKLILFTDGDI